MLGKTAERLLRKQRSDDDVRRYVGDVKAAYLSYATIDEVRTTAASGGSTSAMLIHGLEHGVFDGAVVCETVVIDGRVRPRFAVATTAEAVLAARGSTYVETRFVRDVLPLIRAFDGTVAVVGLPCDITTLRRHADRDPELDAKVTLTIALVCGHNSRTELIDRLEQEVGASVTEYRFSVGHWRGRLEAEFSDGTLVSKPSREFKTYQNLYVCAERKCMSCSDHYGYDADISSGDVWLYRLKSDPIKRTDIITRTDRGQFLFDSAARAGDVDVEAIDVRVIMDGQSRIGPSHYNVTARARAGRRLGIKVRDDVNARVTWHEYVNAIFSVGTMKLSESERGRRLIFALPRPVLRAYLFVKKSLESLP